MARYIDKDDLATKIDNILDYADEHWDTDYVIGAQRFADKLQNAIDTLEVREVDLENYNKVKRLLSSSFMHFLDTNCPEGKMCLSNGECFDIDRAFDELDFAKLHRYMEKYLKAQKGE